MNFIIDIVRMDNAKLDYFLKSSSAFVIKKNH